MESVVSMHHDKVYGFCEVITTMRYWIHSYGSKLNSQLGHSDSLSEFYGVLESMGYVMRESTGETFAEK